MKIIFMGTPHFAVPTLNKLIFSHHKIVAVYTQPPKTAGRGQKQMMTEVHQLALLHNLKVYTPSSLRSELVIKEFLAHEADIVVVAAYGLILPKEILTATTYGCINLHPSDLPKWRGAAPIQRAIIAGDLKNAICVIKMDEGLDTGDIITREEVIIADDANSLWWHDYAAKRGSKLIIEVINNINNIVPIRQSNVNVSYANKISKSEALINWHNKAIEIDRLIKGLNPWPVAFFKFNNEDIKILQAEIVNMSGAPGTVLDEKLTIACLDKSIRPILLQRPSRKVMHCLEMLKGFNIPKNSLLSHAKI